MKHEVIDPAGASAAPGSESSGHHGNIAAVGLTKDFGGSRAVDDLSFTVERGSVTGFLGPNGAGKTTTLRMILGLTRPTSGYGTVSGGPYASLANPGKTVGALLEATSFHPGRTARNHLRVFSAAARLPDRRADEVLELVGLADAANRTVRGYSLGMRQRLGLATALLGDPQILILDEPANGLDPEGIVWLRALLRHFADDEGRTVLVSSHVLSEVEQTVDRVVIIARGKLVYEGTLKALAGRQGAVAVRTPFPTQLSEALNGLDVAIALRDDGVVLVTGATPQAIGHAAWLANVEVHELVDEVSSLEETFLQLTAGSPPSGRAGKAV